MSVQQLLFFQKVFFCSHSIIVRKIEQVGYFYILQKIVYAFTEHNLQKKGKNEKVMNMSLQ